MKPLQQFRDNQQGGIEDSRKCKKNSSIMGNWKDRVCNTGYKPVSILYSQTLFKRRRPTKLIGHVIKMEKPWEGLESSKYQVSNQLFIKAKLGTETYKAHF